MNFFSSDPFLGAVARAFFPGRRTAIGMFRVGGAVFRLLAVDGGRPVTALPFLDLVEPVDPEPATARAIDYLPSVCLESLPVGAWRPAPPDARRQPCPFVRWRGFPTYASFQEHLRAKGRYADPGRNARQIARDLGPTRFEFHDPREQTLWTCLRWKSAQYRASGQPDHFADRRFVLLFFELLRRGALTVSLLSAGDRPLSAHVGALWEGRFYSWIPAYDPDVARYGPGRLLLERLLAHGFDSGHDQFDFLIGDEPYKFKYATDVRVAGPTGRAPSWLRAARRFQRLARLGLSRLPRLEASALAVRRSIRVRGLSGTVRDLWGREPWRRAAPTP